MNITIITGSAHKNGTTAYLTEQFIKGAEEAGHTIYRFDAAYKMYTPALDARNVTAATFDALTRMTWRS